MIIIIMGVTGSGKTTVGSLLARELGWRFWDADDFQQESNIRKMRSGVPLSDDDRLPWLRRLKALLDESLRLGESGVLACSSLKDSYRRLLADGTDAVRFVYLRGSADLLRARLQMRQGHFMDRELLDSQFAALEEPEDAITVEVSLTPQEIADAIRRAMDLQSGGA
jgi:gluconokinase